MTNTPIWTKGFEANPAALTIACVEGANRGAYIGRYTRDGRRVGQIQFTGHGASEAAHKAAELHNGPDADRAMYPERY